MTRLALPLSLAAKKQIDQVCLRFEAAWKEHGRPRVACYLEGVAEPEFSHLLRELLLLDVDYRLHAGEMPVAEDYAGDLPEHQRVVKHVLRQSGLATPPATVEARILGDYELLEEIARGGMGVVFRARQRSLDRIVALKMIPAGRLASPEDIERLRQEANTAAGLQHPNIVAIHEVGQHEGQHYFSMDFVDGTSLAALVREAPLPARRAAQYLHAVAGAVQYAHERGILHRDLKPSNIIIDKLDQPRITDFGLAKRIDMGPEPTASGQVIGTPSFMPPEQASGRLSMIGPASDVYSLGATLFELVTGRPPFQGETSVDTVIQVLDSEPISPRRLNPNVPRDLETICLKCLEKEPYRRYPSAQALADELQRFMTGQPIRARAGGPLSWLGRWYRRRPLVVALTLALLVTLIAGTIGSTYLALVAASNARKVTQRLWESYLAQARAQRRSRQVGQQFQVLETIAAAAAIRTSPGLRDEAIAALALVDARLAHEWRIDAQALIAIDPSVAAYAVTDSAGRIRVHNLVDNRQIQQIECTELDQFFAISTEGRFLAARCRTGDKSECHVWEVRSGKQILQVPMLRGSHFSFLPDNQRIAVLAQDRAFICWDLTTGRQLQAISLPADLAADTLRCHPERPLVALYQRHGRLVHILDLAEERIVGSLLTAGTADAAWRPDTTRIVTACDDFLVYEWDAMSGRQLAVLRGHQAEAMGVTISGRGDLVATRSWDETLRIWEPQTGGELLQIPGRFAYDQLSGDGKRLGFRAADRVGVYEIAPRCWCSLRERNAVGKGPWEVNFDSEGRRVVSASDDGARIWDSDSGCELALLPMKSCLSAGFAHDGRELYTCSPDGLRRWPLILSEDRRTLRFGSPTALQGAIQSDSPRARASWNKDALAAVTGPDAATIFPWGEPRQHNQQPVVLQGHRNVGSVALSADGRWAATGQWGGQGLMVWNARTGERVRNLVTEPGGTLVAFSPDNKWLAGSTRDEYRLWEVGSWRLRLQLPHASALAPLAFSADGHMLAIASSRSSVELRDPDTGARLATLESPAYGFLSWLSFSPDGGKLAAASLDHTVQIWNLRELQHRLSHLSLGLGR